MAKQIESRQKGRAAAMKMVYEWEMGGEGGEDTRLNLLGVEPGENEVEYMNAMFEGVMSRTEEIDEKISSFSKGWTLDRITRVDLAILRLGTYELMLGKVPAGVVINEAVELANEYSTDKAGAFINGVLGNIARGATR